MITYIYELELSNGMKYHTKKISDIVDFVNSQYSNNELFKKITPNIVRNGINGLSQYPKCIKNITRHNYHNFFRNEFEKRTNGTDKLSQTKRSINMLYATIYKEFIVNQFNTQINKWLLKNTNIINNLFLYPYS